MKKSSTCVLFLLLFSSLTVLEVWGSRCLSSAGSSSELQTTAAWISRFPVIVKAVLVSLDTRTDTTADIEIQEIYKGKQ